MTEILAWVLSALGWSIVLRLLRRNARLTAEVRGIGVVLDTLTDAHANLLNDNSRLVAALAAHHQESEES